MKIPVSSLRQALLLLVVLAGFALAGCASTESDNVSARPWNTPQTWENGMPGGMFDQYK